MHIVDPPQKKKFTWWGSTSEIISVLSLEYEILGETNDPLPFCL